MYTILHNWLRALLRRDCPQAALDRLPTRQWADLPSYHPQNDCPCA
ncbi:hypothetical protein PSQ90_06685 [Devosia rhodophyticola]|uniref:Uncharacterized protein n=1 Tax=Devosia rhodophyticola TaxID=3026423 RepID=A0ABY7Z0E7_9HYPH|nr:hypothetical protein [Devosia rhodophyticola]WDR07115.1 hypothetical protein PSQ90_06685 [Devosia rhodophyticola]